MNQFQSQAQSTALDQALVMTRQMLDLAKEGSWEQVSDIEVNRQKSLMQSFQESSPVDRTSELGLRIQEIMGIDNEIQSLVNEARNSIRDELVEISRVKNQAKAYESK